LDKFILFDFLCILKALLNNTCINIFFGN
jgi:hypothetical protein